MNETSLSVKEEFDQQFESIKQLDKKDSRLKVKILYTVFICVFLFVLYGTIISLRTYYEKKDAIQNQVAKPVVIEIK